MALGNFSIKNGTSGNDNLSANSLQAVFGLAGNDRLTAGGNLSGGAGVLAGGLGDDTYIIPTGKGGIILDSGGNDTVIFPFSSTSQTGYFYTVDNRHLVIGDSSTSTFGVIADWRNSVNQVEKIVDSAGIDVTSTLINLSNNSSIPNIPIQQTNSNGFGYLPVSTGLNADNLSSFVNDISELAVGKPLTTAPLTDFKKDAPKYMGSIRDYDGNDLGGSSSWKLLGDVDIQGDGDLESILVNPAIGRFASVGSANGNVDFTKYGLNGDTRVVGIYIDPTLKDKPQNIGGPFDSQRRFQNDLRIDNLKVLAAGDYNKDGFQDLYFRLGDGSAVLRAVMFADGNIQYANYQSKADLTAFMTTNNVPSSVWGGWI
jgi:hypothetical protein